VANFKVAAIRDKRRAMTISIDDFRHIELRVATVTAAAPHPNADRLLVLTIDLGSEQRQLVAGIRAHYTDQDLIGKQVVVVANLQPASLRGVESQGMLLAASDDQGRLAIVTPEKPVANGAQVK
jgi:methionyl-tRNA synthetase